jgi:hypothetical protein
MNRNRSLFSVSLFCFSITGFTPASAALLDWDGNESVDGNFDGDFDVAANWNPTQIPAAGDAANFNADAAYTVTFRSDEEADDLHLK